MFLILIICIFEKEEEEKTLIHYKYREIIKYATPRLKVWHVTQATVKACLRVPVLTLWCTNTGILMVNETLYYHPRFISTFRERCENTLSYTVQVWKKLTTPFFSSEIIIYLGLFQQIQVSELKH